MSLLFTTLHLHDSVSRLTLPQTLKPVRSLATPSAPYSTILQALSSIFRQLLDSRAELNQFWQASRDRLGPCMHNVQLLHSAIPELKEISELFGYRSCTTEVEVLQTDQARARFLALVLDVITVLTQLKSESFHRSTLTLTAYEADVLPWLICSQWSRSSSTTFTLPTSRR